jgi:rhodanese-related sulfurtransferase
LPTQPRSEKGTIHVIDQISVADLRVALDSGSGRVIDVREQQEYDSGHIPGAVWIPMFVVPLRADEFTSTGPVYVVCRSGNRSGQVVTWLASQGIQTINVHGGTQMWRYQGFPTEMNSPAGRTGQP